MVSGSETSVELSYWLRSSNSLGFYICVFFVIPTIEGIFLTRVRVIDDDGICGGIHPHISINTKNLFAAPMLVDVHLHYSNTHLGAANRFLVFNEIQLLEFSRYFISMSI